MSKKDINTDRYINEINKLSLTDERKLEIMSNIKNDTTQNKVTPLYKVGKIAVAVACACVITTVTAYAIGVLKSPAEMFSPIFGVESEQTAYTDLIDKIGTSIGLSSTSNGVTITLDGIIGDKSNACTVYTITNEDGSAIEFPAGVVDDEIVPQMNIAYEWSGTRIPDTGHSKSGWGQISRNDDGDLQFVQKITTEGQLPIGDTLVAKFERFVYFENGETIPVLEGNWEIEYLFDYEDLSVVIDVNETYSKYNENYEDDVTYTIESIMISPVSMAVSCSADVGSIDGVVPDEMEQPAVTIVDSNVDVDIPLLVTIMPAQPEIIIHKKDGTTTILYLGGFGGGNDDSTSWVMTSMFEEIILLEDIDKIQVGDIIVPTP